MKKLEMVIIMLAVMAITMILGIAPVFGSQTVGTALWRDPDVNRRIRLAPLPEGYRFGRALPPSIDLEVEWQPIGDPDFYRFITGIFIDPDGALRVIDINPYAMAGMRVWLSEDGGKNWKVERTSGGVFRMDDSRPFRYENLEGRFIGAEELVGCRERAKVILSPFHSGTRPFRIWPLEVETLIKTEFRGRYEQLGKLRSSGTVFLAKCPNNRKVMAFCEVGGIRVRGRLQCVPSARIFVTIDGGKEWIEINPPRPDQSPLRSGSLHVGGLAIRKAGDALKLFLGLGLGEPRRMIQYAVLPQNDLSRIVEK